MTLRFKCLIKILSLIFSNLVLTSDVFSQDNIERINPILVEVGIGYPVSLNNNNQYFDGFINLGYQRRISEDFFSGLLLSSQYRQQRRADFSLSPKFRFGKHLSERFNVSFDAGYSVYSKIYGDFSGVNFGFNFDKANNYGFHIKYEEYNRNGINSERSLVFGLHLSDRKASKIGLPIVGSIAGITGLLMLIISQSR